MNKQSLVSPMRRRFVISASALAGICLMRPLSASETPVDISQSPAPSREQMIRHLRVANRVAIEAMKKGHHPFGATLVAPDNETVLMTQGNINSVNHAESTLARLASDKYKSDYLWKCTLYSTAEPCAMCAGTQYWANIGKLVFGITERQLLDLTGASSENPTMDIPARYVFKHSQKNIRVWGPIQEVAAEIAEPHKTFWAS